jgi:hypothetical protein
MTVLYKCYGTVSMEISIAIILRPLKKRCRILPDGSMGVSPSLRIPPKIGGYRGLIESVLAVYKCLL